MKSLEVYKRPPRKFLGQWISVEIECIFPDPESLDNFYEWCREKKITDYITIKDDGSIDSGAYDESAEIIVTFRYNDWKLIRMVSRKLIVLKVRVNRSCGLHVHFDCRHLTEQDVEKLGYKIARYVPALKGMLPKSRRNNGYCKQKVNHLYDPDNYDNDRYAFVNLLAFYDHKTLEIRGHSGTIDHKKIINWIILCKTIMRSKSPEEEIDTIPDLLKQLKLNMRLKKYIKERESKFKNGNAIDVA